MENTTAITVTTDAKEAFNKAPHQVEDAALKITAQYFSDVLVPYFHIEGEVDHIGPTETVHLELKKLYQDFNLVMKDGSWTHFEFQSTDTKALEDLKRFWAFHKRIEFKKQFELSGNQKTQFLMPKKSKRSSMLWQVNF